MPRAGLPRSPLRSFFGDQPHTSWFPGPSGATRPPGRKRRPQCPARTRTVTPTTFLQSRLRPCRRLAPPPGPSALDHTGHTRTHRRPCRSPQNATWSPPSPTPALAGRATGKSEVLSSSSYSHTYVHTPVCRSPGSVLVEATKCPQDSGTGSSLATPLRRTSGCFQFCHGLNRWHRSRAFSLQAQVVSKGRGFITSGTCRVEECVFQLVVLPDGLPKRLQPRVTFLKHPHLGPLLC